MKRLKLAAFWISKMFNNEGQESNVNNEQTIDLELEIKRKELENHRFIETLKIIVTGFVVTLIPTIINNKIQDQKVEIQRLKEEISYLDKFSDEVAKENDLVKRRNYVEYLSEIAHSDKSRDRWKQYLKIIEPDLEFSIWKFSII